MSCVESTNLLQAPEHHVVAVQTDHILCKEVSLAVILLTPNSLKQTLATCKSKCVVRFFPEMDQFCYFLWTSHNNKLSASPDPHQGLCLWTPLGAPPQTPVIGSITLPRSPCSSPSRNEMLRTPLDLVEISLTIG